MKKIALILCLVLVASFVLSGCNNSDSIITLEDREAIYVLCFKMGQSRISSTVY